MRYTRGARALALGAILVSGACGLTACSQDDTETKAAATASSEAGKSADQKSDADRTSTSPDRNSSTDDAGKPADGESAVGEPGGSPDQGAPAEDAGNPAGDDSAARDDFAAGRSPAGVASGVSGSFTNGTIEFLAPGKYIVSANGKDQQFFVTDSTGVYGAGVLCGTYSTRATTRCSLDELERGTNSGSVAADVVLKRGVATRITERTAPDEGPAVDDQ
ncbi:hypothetical protein [Streptomyces sp. NPDC017448]|uniref:hypothetical protein n=1 Tax=Streptomyces sp. NPDC017448 TaxID=3364996 RepID=UPI0037BDF7A1